MKITSISVQAKNPDRVNVSVDGRYLFSLDIFQVGDLGVKVGKEYGEDELAELETESLFGKLYGRTLEYCLLRPHSIREVRDYLWRKTRDRRGKDGGTIKGYSPSLAERVLGKLEQKGYVDDEQFARWWVETRNLTKGTSLRKLRAELQSKGVAGQVVDAVLAESDRNDESEIRKIIAKKQARYPDEQKLIQYLARQGFGYDEVKSALTADDVNE